jgi:hypothetical protein
MYGKSGSPDFLVPGTLNFAMFAAFQQSVMGDCGVARLGGG